MVTFYKSEVVCKKKYYLDSHKEKQYLNGDPENDKVLCEAALLTGSGISSEKEVIYTGYGETPEESQKIAKIFSCLNLSKYKNLEILEAVSIETEKDLVWLEERIKKVSA